MLPSTSASGPVPAMPTVNSRPGRNVSTSTGWRYLASSSAQTAGERLPVADLRGRRDALAGPFGQRLGEQRQRQVDAVDVLDPLDHGEIGAWPGRRRGPRPSSCPCAASTRATSGSENV